MGVTSGVTDPVIIELPDTETESLGPGWPSPKIAELESSWIPPLDATGAPWFA